MGNRKNKHYGEENLGEKVKMRIFFQYNTL